MIVRVMVIMRVIASSMAARCQQSNAQHGCLPRSTQAGRSQTNTWRETLGVSLATVERLTHRMQQEDTIHWSGTRRSGNFRRT